MSDDAGATLAPPDVATLLRRADLFRTLGDTALVALASALEQTAVAAGTTVLVAGEPGDALYIVAAGRLRIFAPGAGADAPTAELGPGDVVGELALLSDRPRTATAQTIRDSVLLRLSRDAFVKLAMGFPEILLAVSRAVVDRVQVNPTQRRRRRGRVRTIALMPAGSTARARAVECASGLAQALGNGLAVHVATSEGIDIGVAAGASQSRPGQAGHDPVVRYLDDIEARHAFVLYVTDAEPTPWSERCLRQADRVLLVADAQASPLPGPLERTTATAARRDLVLMHPDNGELPSDSVRWLAARPLSAHHHVRRGRASDYSRLGRGLAGRSIGLVLGGGGPRGFVHLGVLRALDEAGIPVDAVGGTSIGAIMGLTWAMGWDDATRIARAKAALAETPFLIGLTLPLVSLSSATKVTRLLHRHLGDTAIEDLWTPFFCVSTSLTKREPVIHDRGPAWWAVRASISQPGVLPPLWDGGDLLVDGGVLNDLPVDIMHARIDGSIIAVDLQPSIDHTSYEPFGPALSGWQVLGRRLNPLSRSLELPNALQIVMLTKELAAHRIHMRELAGTPVALHLTPPLEQYGMLDFRAALPLIEVGYRYTMEVLERTDTGHLLEAGATATGVAGASTMPLADREAANQSVDRAGFAPAT